MKDVTMAFAEGQSDSIVEDIENMVRSYVEKVSYLTFWYLDGWYKLFSTKYIQLRLKVFLRWTRNIELNQVRACKSRKQVIIVVQYIIPIWEEQMIVSNTQWTEGWRWN